MTANAFLVAADLSSYGIPVAALIVSAAALVFGTVAGRSRTLTGLEQVLSSRIQDLSNQVDGLKDELRECARTNRKLQDENWRLSRKVAGLENGRDDA